MPKNHHGQLFHQLITLADELASRDQAADADAEQLRDAATIIEHLPCQHEPETTAQLQPDWCRCRHCHTALKRVWVVDSTHLTPQPNHTRENACPQ